MMTVHNDLRHGFAASLLLVGLSLAMHGVPQISWAEPARGVVGLWSGVYRQNAPQPQGLCPATGCVGDLVTCGPGEGIVISTFTFSLLEGVCDDAGATPCAGKTTGLSEGCFDLTPPPTGRDIKVAGTVLSITTHGKDRFCFDAAALSDCSGSPPSATVISEGPTVIQLRQTPAFTGPYQGTTEHRLEETNEFTQNGRSKRLRKGTVVVGQFTSEPNPGDNCGGSGCGFAGASVKVAP